MKLTFNALASPLAFLASAVATAYTAPNPWVAIGGIGLSVAAALFTEAATTGYAYIKTAKISAISANVALTINGLLMIKAGVEAGDAELIRAGILLGAANGIFYGPANYLSLRGKMSNETHSKMCMAAGTSIAAAGWPLSDPILSAIGAGFVGEAFLRSPYYDALHAQIQRLRPKIGGL